MDYRKKKVKAAAFSEFIASFFSIIPVSHCCLFLPAQVFPFTVFFNSLPYEYPFRIFKVCDANFDQLHRPCKKKNPPKPPPTKTPPHPTLQNPKRPLLCGYLILPKKKSYKSATTNQRAGFVYKDMPGVPPCIRGGDANADTLFSGDVPRAFCLAFQLEEFLTVAF